MKTGLDLLVLCIYQFELCLKAWVFHSFNQQNLIFRYWSENLTSAPLNLLTVLLVEVVLMDYSLKGVQSTCAFVGRVK